MARFWKVLLPTSVAAVLSLGTWLYFRTMRTASVEKPEISLPNLKKQPEPEPGEPAPVTLLKSNMSCGERQAFLAGDFKLLRKVAELPVGIQRLYTVRGDIRIAMADPGQRFESTDVITDPRLPTWRLVIGGVFQDRAFVNYEQGGRARFFVLEFFLLKSPDTAIGVWRGLYGPARGLEDVRRILERGCK